MQGLFESGAVVDIALAAICLEIVVFALLGRRFAPAMSWPGFMANIASGAFLLLALKLALDGASWHWLAAAMTGALVTHVLDMTIRLKAPRVSRSNS